MPAEPNVQIIEGPDGKPLFVVIPYQDYIAMHPREDLVPHEVVGLMVTEALSPAAAWRQHLGLTQAEVAKRIGISQAAYAQQETAKRPRRPTRERIDMALGIGPEMLDLL